MLTHLPSCRFEAILLGEGEKKVEVTPETRTYHSQTPLAATDVYLGVPNAALFTLNKEDHTLGNVIRDKLLRSNTTQFAAYQVPHPLFPKVVIRVQTDGSIQPREAVATACRDLIGDLEAIKQEFTKEWELKRIAMAAEGEEEVRPNGVNGYGAQNGYSGGYQQSGYQQAGQQSGYSYGYGGANGANGGFGN